MDVWKKTFIDKKSWWHESEASVITTEGLKSADVFVIRIPDTSIVIKKDDYLVKGECGIDVTSVKDLKGMKYCKVTSANYNIFGDEANKRWCIVTAKRNFVIQTPREVFIR